MTTTQIDTEKWLSSDSKPFLWVVAALAIYGTYYFINALIWERMPVGDQLTIFLQYSYEYSGVARGEFPLWNPLNRTGEPTYFNSVGFLANPLFNFVIFISLMLGVKNIYLSYLILNFLLIVSYVIGMYLLIHALTHNHFSSAFGAVLTLGSGLVAWNMHGNTVIYYLHNVPWIFYGLISYFQKFQFRFLVIVILSFTNALYSYQFVYPLAFMFLALVSILVFYRKALGFSVLKKIPAPHIILVAGFTLLSCYPAILIILKTMGGDYLPPSSRIIHSSLNVSKDLLVTWETHGERLSTFFFTCENCWSVMFTGVYFGHYGVARYFIGAIAFSFSILSFFSRQKIVFCLVVTGVLIATLGGDVPPGNIIYSLPIFKMTRYPAQFIIFIQALAIIISAIGFDFFLRNLSPARKTVVIWANICLLIGCVILAIVAIFVPNDGVVIPALSIASITALLLIFLMCNSRSFSKNSIAHLVILISVVTAFSYQYFWKTNNPLLKGWNITNKEVLETKNRTDHSLKFLMQRPDSIETLDEKMTILGTSAFYDEYYSLLSLRDNTYNIGFVKNGGFGSYPLTKEFVAFRAIPNSELFLKEKFFYFNKVLLPQAPDYLSTFIKNPETLKTMLNKNIGVVDYPDNPNHPVYVGDFNLKNINSLKKDSNDSVSSIKINQFKSNSINLSITTNEPGLLAYTDTWDEGWNARVNGKTVPVLRAFHSYKGIELDKGFNEIEFYFQSNLLTSIVVMNVYFSILLAGTAIFYMTGLIKPITKVFESA
jgi:hypothetical protein